jgi:hypothetical protein
MRSSRIPALTNANVAVPRKPQATSLRMCRQFMESWATRLSDFNAYVAFDLNYSLNLLIILFCALMPRWRITCQT